MTILLVASLLAGDPEPSAPASDATRWYGWQTLLADGAPVALLVAAEITIAGAGGDQSKCSACGILFAPSLATYLAGAPLVHAAHRRGLTALGDIGLRIGIPIGGGLQAASMGGVHQGSARKV